MSIYLEFKRNKWYDYFNMKQKVYKDLIKIFYSNGTTIYKGEDDEDEVNHIDLFLTSLARGNYVITPTLLQKVLKLKPTSKNAIIYMGEEDFLSKEEQNVEFFVRPTTFVKFPNSASRLSTHDKILHLIVSHNIKPFKTKHATMITKEMWFMYHIKRSTPINLAQFNFKDMRYLVRGAKNNVVYGMVVSKLIRKLKIDTSTDKSKLYNKIKILLKNTLGRMGYEYNFESKN